jgi:SAM-dependent methyltransferase
VTSTRSERAWADFWRAGGLGPESGCLPGALRQIDAVQRQVWTDVARSLPRGARVLDLATGDGAVLGKLRDSRPELKLVGVDSSAVLPKGLKGARLKAGVPMEKLPFPAASFDLVTSQFGFEYGDTRRIAAELRRVLKPGARFAFIVHHAGGPIVAHNHERLGSLVWMVRDSGLLEKAEALARARALTDLPTPPLFRQAAAETRARFPGQSVGEEFATAVATTLDMGRGRPSREALEVLATLRAKAENEIARIEALIGAARTAEQVELLGLQLRAVGLEPGEAEMLREASGRAPFAWLLAGANPV